MNNEMAINTYLSTIEPKKETRETRKTETELWIQRIISWLPDGRRGKWMRVLRSTNR